MTRQRNLLKYEIRSRLATDGRTFGDVARAIGKTLSFVHQAVDPDNRRRFSPSDLEIIDREFGPAISLLLNTLTINPAHVKGREKNNRRGNK